MVVVCGFSGVKDGPFELYRTGDGDRRRSRRFEHVSEASLEWRTMGGKWRVWTMHDPTTFGFDIALTWAPETLPDCTAALPERLPKR